MTLVVLGAVVDGFAVILALLLRRLIRAVERVNAEAAKQNESLGAISKEAGEAYCRLVEALDRAEGRWDGTRP